MSIRIIDPVISNCRIGIITDSNVDLHVQAPRITECLTGIEIREPGLLAELGLKADTPPELVAALLDFLKKDARRREEIEAAVKSSGITKWLAIGANVTTIIDGLMKQLS